MKHRTDYVVLSHQADEDWESVAIFPSATKENIRFHIVRLYLNWGYEENEDNLKEIDEIVEALYGDNQYIGDFDNFKIETVPFYE